MPEFSYEALDKGGRTVKGVIEAGSEEVIIEKLRNMGYYPLNVAINKTKSGSNVDISALPGLRMIFHRVKLGHVMTFTRQLATLIDAGLPIIRSLAILSEQVESVIFRDIIKAVSKDIESGSSLSDSLAKYPKVFDSLFVNMVRAGEVGGVLEAVLNKVAQFLENRQALIGKVKSAMMYPVIVMVLALGIVSFILVFILPKFQDIFSQLGAELPMPTQILLTASSILTNYWYWVIAFVIIMWQIVKKINSTKEGKYVFDRIKLRLPVFGELFKKLAITRFADTLATLITSGVPILQALDIVRETSGNEVVTRAMDSVYESVKEGETIYEPLGRCSVFPPLVVHMVAVGEETGAVDQMLRKVAEAYQREVDDTVAALTSIMEPILIVFLGVIVGGIVVALYLPMFNLPKAMGAKS